MALSDHIDSEGGGLIREDSEPLPPLVYKDNGKWFTGRPKTIIFSDSVRYFDADGRELEAIIDKPLQDKKDFLRA